MLQFLLPKISKQDIADSDGAYKILKSRKKIDKDTKAKDLLESVGIKRNSSKMSDTTSKEHDNILYSG